MATIKGGDKLESALRELSARVAKAASVQVGFLPDSTYPDGTPVATVAAIQEFGAPSRNIPPRPFFRSMIAAKSGEWPGAVATNLKANDYDADRSLNQVGAAISGQLRQSITDFDGVPLSPKTVKAKGFDKQLVDTGVMLNSVDFAVK